jgi:hypothetical protein
MVSRRSNQRARKLIVIGSSVDRCGRGGLGAPLFCRFRGGKLIHVSSFGVQTTSTSLVMQKVES